ncbi:MAG: hypothetical protein ACPGRD_03425, partial [Planktomarina sp.]
HNLVETQENMPVLKAKSARWHSPELEGMKGLELRIGTSPVIYELVGSGSGLPSRQRTCEIIAYLPDNRTEAISKMSTVISGKFEPIAKTLDYSVYAADGYQIKPSDIELSFKPSQFSTYYEMREGAKCLRSDPCRSRTPFKLTLRVVLERLP